MRSLGWTLIQYDTYTGTTSFEDEDGDLSDVSTSQGMTKFVDTIRS